MDQNKDRCCEVIQCEVMEFLHCQEKYKLSPQNNVKIDDRLHKPSPGPLNNNHGTTQILHENIDEVTSMFIKKGK